MPKPKDEIKDLKEFIEVLRDNDYFTKDNKFKPNKWIKLLSDFETYKAEKELEVNYLKKELRIRPTIKKIKDKIHNAYNDLVTNNIKLEQQLAEKEKYIEKEDKQRQDDSIELLGLRKKLDKKEKEIKELIER